MKAKVKNEIDYLIAQTKAEREISKASEIAFSYNPVKSFVEQCLFLVSRDSLTKIGQQSGFLFASQGSTTPDYGPSDEGKLFASYNGIKATFLGNNMPPLKKESGENSIEDQLTAFVESNIDKCLDFSAFENQGLKITKKEKFVDARLTIATLEDGTVSAFQKGGNDALTQEEIFNAIDIAVAKGKELRKLL